MKNEKNKTKDLSNTNEPNKSNYLSDPDNSIKPSKTTGQ